MKSARPQRTGVAAATCASALMALTIVLAQIGGDTTARHGIAPMREDAPPARVHGRSVQAEESRLQGSATLRGNAVGAPAVRDAASSPFVASADGFATCSIAGRITRGGADVIARVRIEAERGAWTDLVTDASGAFARSGLRAGQRRVTVEVEGLPACTRSVRLRPYHVARLDLDLGCRELVRGSVHDVHGAVIEGAELMLDGERGASDADGRFALLRRASGTAELVVRAPGFAWFTCAVPEGKDVPLEIALEPACTLEVVVPESLRGQDVAVHVAPGGFERTAGSPARSATPWHLMSPVRFARQQALLFENLPEGEVDVWIVGADSVARSDSLRTSAEQSVRSEPRVLETTSNRGSLAAALWRSQSVSGSPRQLVSSTAPAINSSRAP